MAVTSLIAPATIKSFLALAAAIAAEIMLSAPAREGRKARKKIASSAFDINSNRTSRSGGVFLPFLTAVVLGEYQSSTLPEPLSVASTGVWSASRILGPWRCRAFPAAVGGRGGGNLSASSRSQ